MEVPPTIKRAAAVSGSLQPQIYEALNCFAGESSLVNIMLCYYILFFVGQPTDVLVIQSLFFDPVLTLLNQMCVLTH